MTGSERSSPKPINEDPPAVGVLGGPDPVEIVAKMIYDQNPSRWLTREEERGTVMTPWEHLKPSHHARKQAIRDAEMIETVFRAALAGGPDQKDTDYGTSGPVGAAPQGSDVDALRDAAEVVLGVLETGGVADVYTDYERARAVVSALRREGHLREASETGTVPRFGAIKKVLDAVEVSPTGPVTGHDLMAALEEMERER